MVSVVILIVVENSLSFFVSFPFLLLISKSVIFSFSFMIYIIIIIFMIMIIFLKPCVLYIQILEFANILIQSRKIDKELRVIQYTDIWRWAFIIQGIVVP